MGGDSRELYKITFGGEVVGAMSRGEVAENLKARFKFNEAALEKMFSGKAVVLKSGLDKETAERFARGLWQAGARCRVEPVAGAGPIETLPLATPSQAATPNMVCPRCGEEQSGGLTCRACGARVETACRKNREAAPAVSSAPPPAAPVRPRQVVTGGVTSALAETRPWVRAVAILMALSSGLGLFGAIGVFFVGRDHGASFALGKLVFQLPFFLLSLLPAYFLFQYGSAIGTYLEGENVAALECALEQQKAFWKLVGILSVIGIGIGLLGIAAAILLPLLIGGH